MSIEIVGVVVLIVVFALSAWRGLNMGILAFVAAFALGVLYLHLPVGDVLEGFPGGLFIVLLGVTFLFGIARINGTVDWLVAASMTLVRNRATAMPWVLFLLAAALAAAGAASPAAVAIVAPIGISFAVRNRLSPLYVGLMAVNGAAAGSFSPVGILGGVVTSTLNANNMTIDSGTLFMGTFAFNTALSVVVWLVFGRTRPPQVGSGTVSGSTGVDPTHDGGGGSAVAARERVALDQSTRVTTRLGIEQATTLVGMGVLIVAATILELDAGFTALLVGTVLALLFPHTARTAMGDIAWPVILMVCGIVTYISLLESQGIVHSLGQMITAIGVPLLAALVIAYVGGVVSAFASTTAILGALIPLSVPFLQSGTVSTTGLVVALCAAATVVDASPFSTNGALVIANSPEEQRQRAYRGLLAWGAAMTVTGPLLAWLVFVVF